MSAAAGALGGATRPRLRLAALGLPLVMLLSLALRVAPWLANAPLHHDEALYGAWARLISSGQDPLLLTPWVDKPPLTLYLIAGSFSLFGVSEMALRLPGMLAALLLIPVVYGFARRAAGPAPALLAAVLVALSPFTIAFAPTAFTDGWLALWLFAAAWAALARRPFLAGVLLGLAVASKQQGVLGIPLILALLALNLPRRRRGLHYLAAVGLGVLGCALILAPVTWWDSLRWHNRPSFWDRSLQTYGGLILAPPAEWPRRAVMWAGPARYLFGAPLLTWGLLGVLLAAAPALLRRPALGVLFAYVCGYLALHIAVTFQPWDRYLLPLAPALCVLLAGAAQEMHRRLARLKPAPSRDVARGLFRLFVYAAIAAVFYGAALAATGRLPIGSNGAVYQGVAAAAHIIRGQDPDVIVYYRRLGWHLDFYLFDAPQERRWYGDAAKIASDAGQTAQLEPERDQWLVLPQWEDDTLGEIRAALAVRGLALEAGSRVLRADGSAAVTLYRIAPGHSEGVQP